MTTAAGHERRDALPVGTALRDYTVEAVLGHGGFGIVYRARHRELGNLVAVKEYLPIGLAVREGVEVHPRSAQCRSRYEGGLRRFRDEARSLIDFQNHPNIVSCREFFRANGAAYLVMEYEDGLPLSDLLRGREAEGRPFEEADLLAVMVPLLEGLTQVHQAGALHRDIKPANILVRRADERPVLIDFGAAKQAVAGHSESMAPYTEGYAALEQVGEGELGPWTDMYGAGAVMWRMIAGGNRPWEPPNPVKVEKRANALVRGAADPLPAAAALGAGRFSPGVLQAVDRCLKLNEAERVRGCGELVALLRGRWNGRDSAAAATGEKSGRQKESAQEIESTAETSTGRDKLKRRSVEPGMRFVWGALAWIVLLALAWAFHDSMDKASGGSSVVAGGDLEKLEREVAQARQAWTAWEKIAESQNEEELGAYIAEYRGMAAASGWVTLAQERLDDLARIRKEKAKEKKERQEKAREAERARAAEEAWAEVAESQSEEELGAYITKYRGAAAASGWVMLAEERLDDLARIRKEKEREEEAREAERARAAEEAWAEVAESQNEEELGAYITKYQGMAAASGWVMLAEERLDDLARIRKEKEREEKERRAARVRAAGEAWAKVAESLGEEELEEYVDKWGGVAEAALFVIEAKARLSDLVRAREAREKKRRFQDCPVCPELVAVPAGSFSMGSPESEEWRSANEGPQHRVTIPKAFAVGAYEVTFEEWDACAADGGCGGYRPRDRGWGRGRRPVIYVSWKDAQQYLDWLRQKTEKSYRLLSEAEWEYAARAGSRTPYSFGDSVTPRQANYLYSRVVGTTPVGSYRPNGFGLYDMHGNVWEWVQDNRHKNYKKAPRDGSAWVIHWFYRAWNNRVLRGGSLGSYLGDLRSAKRDWRDAGVRSLDVGFRVARTLPP